MWWPSSQANFQTLAIDMEQGGAKLAFSFISGPLSDHRWVVARYSSEN